MNYEKVFPEIAKIIDNFHFEKKSNEHVTNSELQAIYNWEYLLSVSGDMKSVDNGCFRKSDEFIFFNDDKIPNIINEKMPTDEIVENYNKSKDIYNNYFVNKNFYNYNFKQAIGFNYKLFLDKLGIFNFKEKDNIKKIRDNKIDGFSNYLKAISVSIYNLAVYDDLKKILYYQDEQKKVSFFFFGV